ncbi:MAG: hypothetical protein ACT4TC_13680 [Myxococcaceae bacterium]
MTIARAGTTYLVHVQAPNSNEWTCPARNLSCVEAAWKVAARYEQQRYKTVIAVQAMARESSYRRAS